MPGDLGVEDHHEGLANGPVFLLALMRWSD